jgi:hypothetical protein
VVKPDGKTTAPISVTVSIRNIGHAAAPASVTKIVLIQNSHDFAHEKIPLPRLAPGHASTQIAVFRDAEPQLGFVHAGVQADVNNTVPEPLANDQMLSFPIPVIAQRWTGVMESQVHTPGLFHVTEDDDATATAAAFQFSHVDGLKRFAYTVGGTVDQTVTFSEQGCSGSGDGTANMARWGKDSGLPCRVTASWAHWSRSPTPGTWSPTYRSSAIVVSSVAWASLSTSPAGHLHAAAAASGLGGALFARRACPLRSAAARRRADVGVEMEYVVGVVLRLDLGEPLVLMGPVGRTHPVFVGLGHEVHVAADTDGMRR